MTFFFLQISPIYVNFYTELQFKSLWGPRLLLHTTTTIIAGLPSSLLYGWQNSIILELKNGDLCFPGPRIDEVVVVFRGDIKGIPLPSTELCSVKDHRYLPLQNHEDQGVLI